MTSRTNFRQRAARRFAALALAALALAACSFAPLGQADAPTSAPANIPATGGIPTASGVPAATQPATAETPAAPATQSATAAAPAYQQAECKFNKPAGIGVTCGYLTVPEDRNTPNGKTIRLHVAVFKSQSSNPAPDPVVYLEGGPGGHALDNAEFSFQGRFDPFLENRDFIMFDQRGTGFSEPALDCTELTDAAFQKLDQNVSSDQSNKIDTDATLKCHERLVKAGINLAAYTSAANAADLNDLRIALGYDTWNLYGISYGTRLALTEMRDFPTGVRSVILDSSYPLQASLDLDVPASAARVFSVLFDGCAADAACNQSYPQLKTMFFELVNQLNTKPVTVSATDPLTNKEYQVVLNGDKLISTLFQSFYATEVIPLLPKAIDAAHSGRDYSLLARLHLLFGAAQSKYISYGMYFSVQCGEETRFETQQQLVDADQPYPEQHNTFDAASAYSVCQQWGAKPAAEVENEPVTSNLPTLVLSGEYDPITPPNYNQAVAKTLSKSFLFEFPGIGHGVSISDPCPLGIAKAFLNEPSATPVSTCIKAMREPAFDLPSGPVTLKPFENKSFGIKGVAPEGWAENTPGIYIRSNASNVVLLQQVAPGTRDNALQLFSQQFKLAKPPAATGSRKTSSLAWSLYEFTVQGQPVDLALAEQDQKTYIVLLASEPAERKALYDQLFLPVIDAYTPTP
ncbi:MAG: alpha/beta hydrolase [Roseiflexaceae bacterium]